MGPGRATSHADVVTPAVQKRMRAVALIEDGSCTLTAPLKAVNEFTLADSLVGG